MNIHLIEVKEILKDNKSVVKLGNVFIKCSNITYLYGAKMEIQKNYVISKNEYGKYGDYRFPILD